MRQSNSRGILAVCTMYLGHIYEYLFNDYDKLRNLKMNKLSVVILLPRELKREVFELLLH